MTTTSPPAMRPAEFRTRLDALGVSRDFVAERAGVTRLVVFRNQDENRKRDVNPRLVDVLLELEREFGAAVAAIALDAEGADLKTLPRYATADEWAHATPELPGWPFSAQAALLTAVQRRIGGRVTIEYAQ